MTDPTGTFHLSRPRLDGPAERTVVEPWITRLPHVTLNAYAETSPVLAVIEALPVQVPAAVPAHVPAVQGVPGRRVALAA